MNTIQKKALAYLLTVNDGCIPSSEWTNGSGRFTTKKAVPRHCELLPIVQAVGLAGKSGVAARKLNKARPNIRKVVVVTNRRAAHLAVKES